MDSECASNGQVVVSSLCSNTDVSRKSCMPTQFISGQVLQDDGIINEISGIDVIQGRHFVAVGDAGFLFFGHVNENGTVVMDRERTVKLELPNEVDVFVDSESIVVLNGGQSVLIGAEHDKNGTGGIYEYDLKGKLLTKDPLPKSLFKLLSMDNENQRYNGGFEALCAGSLDGDTLVFTTEVAVFPDEASTRRIVVYKRHGAFGGVYKYIMQNPKAGIVDMVRLDNNGQHFSVMERAYDNTTGITDVRLYVLDLTYADVVPIDLSSMESEPDTLTERFRDLYPITRVTEFFDFAPLQDQGLVDNYEGAALLPCGKLLVVSDNNKHNGTQKTIFTTLQLPFYKQKNNFNISSQAEKAFMVLLLVIFVGGCILGPCGWSIGKYFRNMFCPTHELLEQENVQRQQPQRQPHGQRRRDQHTLQQTETDDEDDLEQSVSHQTKPNPSAKLTNSQFQTFQISEN